MDRARTRHLRGTLLLAAAATAFGLGLAEIAVRVLDVGPHILALNHGIFRISDNPRLRYELAPNAVDGKTRISSAGLRDHEFSLAKPPGVFRIACIGDSITFGFGLPVADSYPKRLEGLLNVCCAAPGRRYEVMNFGVPGYNLKEIAETLRSRVLDYRPDFVVYGYCLNDPQECSLEFLKLLADLTEAGREFVAPAQASRFLETHSRLWRLIVYAFRRSTARGRTIGGGDQSVIATADPEIDAIRKSETAAYFAELHAGAAGRENLARSLDAMASAAAAEDVPVCVFVFPVLDHLDDYPLADVHRQVVEACRQRAFHAFDLLESIRAFQQAEPGPAYLDLLHPAALADDFAAEVMLAQLLRDHLLPGVDADDAMHRLYAETARDPRLDRLKSFFQSP